MTNESYQDNTKYVDIVVWDDKYATGIGVIDAQHMHLLEMTNNLFKACVTRENELETVFKDVMSDMVKYVHFHFDAELKLLHAVNYPNCHDHKSKHDTLIKDILSTVKEITKANILYPTVLSAHLKIGFLVILQLMINNTASTFMSRFTMAL